MKQEIIVLNPERNVTLTAYIQEVEGEFQFAKRPPYWCSPAAAMPCVLTGKPTRWQWPI